MIDTSTIQGEPMTLRPIRNEEDHETVLEEIKMLLHRPC